MVLIQRVKVFRSMNSIFCIIGMMLSSIICDVYAQESPDHHTEQAMFVLEIHGLNKVEGEIRIVMFNSQESYKVEPLISAVLDVDHTSIVWRVEELIFGDYAIAVYHDKNMNGKLDTNFLGIPKERYGFSNNARRRFGPATWDESNFTFDLQNTTHVITIK